ncbi:hypothetical protein [Butyrivibrio proteoclasticus]|uniref:hypothetical protein n=1 Tax=Butyrivibrio proteoclasticus TaxID=43305 RepID=UPI000478C6E6|nr:hypothetical protein [Butyrivibrio proteoclasticus]
MSENLRNDIKKCPWSALVCAIWFSLIWWLMAWTSIRYDEGLDNLFAYRGLFDHPRLVGAVSGVITFILVGYWDKFKNRLDVVLFPMVAAILNVVFTIISSSIWRTDHVYTDWELGFWPDRLWFISWYVIGVCVVFLAFDRLLPFVHMYLRALIVGFVFTFCIWGLLALILVAFEMLLFGAADFFLHMIFVSIASMVISALVLGTLIGAVGYLVIKKMKLLGDAGQYVLFFFGAVYTDFQLPIFGDMGTAFVAFFAIFSIFIFGLLTLVDFLSSRAVKKDVLL